ncbi:MAG: type II toxin-antitoxin system VapC family toxin [Alicyclobacillus herbarius]|uniref:type II toxin-antitoxin system VapC family toxin n=1 Tax=Alicyclobacillus TaxID=29330 RepID=UPI000AD10F05|nr:MULTISPECIES: type II toxin-antitoxin system VapC family toxin [Alicyclobacillus]MCL6633770.1 type II toxin-antitoxin system VapC family toxin [Alicyclobacillus herbarius]
MTFVLDASVALSWCFPDESNDYAARILNRFKQDTATVPAIWPLEVSNALLVGHRRNRMNLEQIRIATKLLSGLEIVVDEVSASHVFHKTLSLALDNGLTAYDAAYLELAQRLKCPLATTDKQLYLAAQSVGVETL